MESRALKWLLSGAVMVLIWTFGSSVDMQLFTTVKAEARPASGLYQLESQIAAALRSRNEQVQIDYTGDAKELSDSIKTTVRQAIAHDEYTAYIVDSYFYSIRTWNGVSRIKLSLRYRETPAQTAEVDRQVASVIGTLIEPGMNDHQKVKAIHDWIVLRLAYDGALANYTAYEALQSGRAVCQGYSLLAYKMLTAAGIPSRIAEGKAASGDHAWNLVLLEGKWFHLDTTWDDPVPDVQGRVRYDYYLKTGAELRRDHSWTRSYPAATADYADVVSAALLSDPKKAAFYTGLQRELGFVWLKPEHTSASADDLRDKLEAAVLSGQRTLKVRYVDGDRAKADLQEALEGMEGFGFTSYKAAFSPFGADGAVLLDVTLQK